MSIFNLNTLTSDVVNNIKIIIKTHGTRFTIDINDFKIPIIIKKVKTDISYYTMKYDIKERTHELYPFKICFIDICKSIINNNAYIANIHKTNKISGTNMVECVILILKELKVKKVYIGDGTEITCGHKKIDLSFFKLLQKHYTFYQKFGFKICEESCRNNYFILEFGHIKNVSTILQNTLDQISKIPLYHIKQIINNIFNLLCKVIKNQDYNHLYFYNYVDFENEPYMIDQTHNKNIVINWIKDIDTLFSFFNKETKKITFIKFIIKQFNEDCNHYVMLHDILLHNYLFKIVYKNQTILLDYVPLFAIVRNIRYSFMSLDL